MLTRDGVGEYSGPAGSPVRIVAKSRDNNDTNGARYRYNEADVPSKSFDNLPGCEFDVLTGRNVFRGQVAFDTAAQPGAAYDLFQLDSADERVSLKKQVLLANGPEGFFSFNITGRAAELAGAPRPKRKARKMGRKTVAKKRRTSKKKAARKPRKAAPRRKVAKARRLRRTRSR